MTIVETVTETVQETITETVTETVTVEPIPPAEPEVAVEEEPTSGGGSSSGSSSNESSSGGSSSDTNDGNNYEPQPLVNDPAPEPDPAPASAYYANCTEAREAGVTPIYRGEPGYRSQLDRDNDGIACE